MSKKAYVLIVIFLGCLAISLPAIYLYLKHEIMLKQRHHLLCEILKPGMSMEEVVGVLHQAGEFTMSKAEWLGGNVELGINFTDSKGQKLYGAFDLRFSDNKYTEAYIRYGSDNFEDICDLYQSAGTLIATPKP